MRRKCWEVLSLVLALVGGRHVYADKTNANHDALEMTALEQADEVDHGVLSLVEATDSVQLGVYEFAPEVPTGTALLFLHGGGAHSQAGYQYLASGLSRTAGVRVFLMDLRGHGVSEGPRGDTPSVEQVWQDVKTVLAYIRERNPDVRLVLGGHSSGAGLLLNYLSWADRSPVDGVVFLAPYLGYKSKTDREGVDDPFSRIDVDVFIKNSMSGGRTHGNTPAVFFNYAEDVLERDPLLISSITCNMSQAMTPHDPRQQMKELDQPFGLFIGEDDEVFDPDKVYTYGQYPAQDIREESMIEKVPGESHLSILLRGGELISRYISATGQQ